MRGGLGNSRPRPTAKRREQVLKETTIARMRKKTRIYQDMKTSSTTEREAVVMPTEVVLELEVVAFSE